MRHYTRRALSQPEAVYGFALPESLAVTLISGCLGGYVASKFLTRIAGADGQNDRYLRLMDSMERRGHAL